MKHDIYFVRTYFYFPFISFQCQPDESSSTETAPHIKTTQRHSHVFSIGAAKVKIKGKIMFVFSTDSISL